MPTPTRKKMEAESEKSESAKKKAKLTPLSSLKKVGKSRSKNKVPLSERGNIPSSSQNFDEESTQFSENNSIINPSSPEPPHSEDFLFETSSVSKVDSPQSNDIFASPVDSSQVFDSQKSPSLHYSQDIVSQSTPRNQNGRNTPQTPFKQRAQMAGYSPASKQRTMQILTPNQNEGTSAGDRRIASPSNYDGLATGRLVIWGTDVCVHSTQGRFKEFILKFKETTLSGCDTREGFYLNKMQEISTLGEPYFDIDCEHLRNFDSHLFEQLIAYPTEVISAFDMVLHLIFIERFSSTSLKHQIQSRYFNVENVKNMRNLNPQDIDRLVSVQGMITRISPPIPDMYQAFFRCYVCSKTTSVDVERGRIAEPTICPNCNTNHSFQLIHNRSLFSDKQIIKLQESPDSMPAGETPQNVLVFAYSELVDVAQPGDRVTIVGVYRALPLRVHPKQRNVKAVYQTHIDVIHISKISSHTHSSDDIFSLDKRKIELVKSLAESSNLYERLAKSIAPSVYENLDVKKGLLLQLFGGTRKSFSGIGKSSCRSDIHILLCGDPGTSKSQLLKFVHSVVPRGQYTSGKGSSAVGLTAYLSRDPDTGQPTLQTGALILADDGICCIDEFDKMNQTTRSVLHEVMEQQTLSLAKSGIICKLNAKTSVLAAANPVDSQWNKQKTIIDNIQLPHTLLSRFDLIFLILDLQCEVYDRRLAKHLISLYHKKEDELDASQEEATGEDLERSDSTNRTDPSNRFLNAELFHDFLIYTKSNYQPKLTEDAKLHLIHTYINMRKIGSSRGHISAYPRQLESLIRLSEAHAKIRWSNLVTLSDVEEAIRLHREAMKASITDPKTGLIDMNILTTGVSVENLKKIKELSFAIKNWLLQSESMQSLPLKRAYQDFKETSDIVKLLISTMIEC